MANFQKIKEIAKERGISLGAIAEQIGMTPTGLSLVMKTNKTMTDKIEMIAKLLHVKVGVFFDEESDTSISPANVDEQVAYYKELLAQKDKIIEQKDQIINILTCSKN
jgi:transcriptional regulator with XRE-family HTH domain